MTNILICIYTYECKLGSEQLLWQKYESNTRRRETTREHGRGRPRQSGERRARWGTTSKQNTGRRASSRARSFSAQKLVKIWLLDRSDNRSTDLLYMCFIVPSSWPAGENTCSWWKIASICSRAHIHRSTEKHKVVQHYGARSCAAILKHFG